MTTVTIGGKKLEGRSITIVVGREIAERDRVGPGESFVIQVEGDLAILNANQSVVMQGDVHGSVHAGNSVTCDAVGGDVSAGGHVKCQDIKGNVKAGGNVECTSVDGTTE
jgi:hypothetical protein